MNPDWRTLTTAEELLFWTDRPGFPCLIYYRLRFSGLLKRAAFEAALRIALDRHPLFQSRVERMKSRRLRWVPMPEFQPAIEWQSGPICDEIEPVNFDLFREPGVRMRVTVDAVGQVSQVLFIYHHAYADGTGGIQFLEDLLLAYAGSAEAVFPILRPELLAERGSFGLTRWRVLQLLPKLLVGLLGVRQYLMRSPVPFVPERDFGPEVSPVESSLHPVTFTFDVKATERLRRERRRLGARVTLNDLLTRDLFLALADWRERENIAKDEDWLRLMAPLNLRTSRLQAMPAANVASLFFLDRQTAAIRDPGTLLRGIHEEIDLIRRNRLGLIFVASSWLSQFSPGGLAGSVRRNARLGTALFTNVGRFFADCALPKSEGRLVAGGVILEEICGIAPHFPGHQVSFCCSIYARKLILTLNADGRYFSSAQAEELLSRWVARLRESMSVD